MRTRILLLIAFFQLATLVFGQQINFYGTTSKGRDSDLGTIFKTDTNGGNTKTLYSIGNNKGKFPNNSKLCKAANGKYYGLTKEGGQYNYGVIYEYDYQNDAYKTIYDFDGYLLGGYPLGSLIQTVSGKLYGMTSSGGAYNEGIIFEYDLNTSTFLKKSDFSSANGSKPNGSLIEASNGKLYGLTVAGGASNLGVLFEYDITSNTYTKKVDFTGINGSGAYGSLLEASNGNLYGVTKDGGTFSHGNIFEYVILSNTLVSKVEFRSSINGSKPYEGLIQATNGKLYGLTSEGGTNDKGVLYEYDIATNVLNKKVDLYTGTGSGTGPRGGLVETTNGDLYGVTSRGGANLNGVIFNYNYLTNLYTVKIDFTGQQGSAHMGTLIQSSNGSLIGTSNFGGANLNGVLYEYDYNTNLFQKLLDFGYDNQIVNPTGKLTYADNGNLYGLSFEGGYNDGGTLFEFNPRSLKLTIKYDASYDILPRGFHPVGDLININDGFLYGLSLKGGTPYFVSLFRYDYTLDTMITLYTFGTIGQPAPFRKYSLLHHSNGKLYGIGNTNASAPFRTTIFEYDISTSTQNIIHNFQPTIESLSLIEGPIGALYGVNTQDGFSNRFGYLFKYDLVTNLYSNMHFFNGVDGKNPVGELVLAGNNKFYGVTNSGGANDKGVIFEYNPTLNLFTKKLDFDSINGANPEDGLAELKHGKLFGTTKFGGTNNQGVVYEYDYVLNTIQVKHNFDSASTGSYPMGRLVKAKDCGITRVFNTVNQCKSYTSPSGKYIWTNSGVYSDTLFNNGCDSILTINLTVSKINNTVATLGPTTLAANAFGATYQWLDCNNNYAIIPNETGQLFTATAIGNYAVEITSNGCVDTSTCYPITVVGISENHLSTNLAVFPNPTNSNITLSLGGLYGAFTTQVYNVHGKLIKESTHQSANQVEVELGESEGIYFIHLIMSNGEKVVRKVVKN